MKELGEQSMEKDETQDVTFSQKEMETDPNGREEKETKEIIPIIIL